MMQARPVDGVRRRPFRRWKVENSAKKRLATSWQLQWPLSRMTLRLFDSFLNCDEQVFLPLSFLVNKVCKQGSSAQFLNTNIA